VTCPNCVSRELITCGTSIKTSLVDSPRDRSRFWGPGCVISRDPITEGTSIETSFVDSQSTRRVPVVYFGISSSIGPQSRPCSWIPNPCDRSGLGIWGSLSHTGPQSRPRWWTSSPRDRSPIFRSRFCISGSHHLWDLVGGWTLNSKIHHLFKQFR
jgi:hypothetical protein